MIGFLIFALAFVTLLTLVARFGRLQVRRELPETNSLALTAGFVALLLFTWWFVTRGATLEQRLVAPLILPSPLEVLAAFPVLHSEMALVRSALASWVRVSAGFALAALVALPLGIFMATFRPIAAFFRPLALAGAYVPIVVFIPLTLVWFGIAETQKVGFLFIACFVALLPLVIKTIGDVPDAYLEVAATKGASQWQLVWQVLFPVAMADLWEHLRGTYGVGWGWIIMAEIVVKPEYGLGGLISVADRRSNAAFIYAVVIVIVIIAFVCDQLWRLGGRLLFPYKHRN